MPNQFRGSRLGPVAKLTGSSSLNSVFCVSDAGGAFEVAADEPPGAVVTANAGLGFEAGCVMVLFTSVQSAGLHSTYATQAYTRREACMRSS